jgi:hypothetical protein
MWGPPSGGRCLLAWPPLFAGYLAWGACLAGRRGCALRYLYALRQDAAENEAMSGGLPVRYLWVYRPPGAREAVAGGNRAGLGGWRAFRLPG